jgi:ribonuclease HII
MDEYEQNAYGRGFKVVAGLDEAGRGPLAGPVVAAAVVLPRDYVNNEIKDSKQLSPKKREKVFKQIKADALSIGLGVIEPAIIDKINIHHASLLAMKEAVENLTIPVDYLLIDGIFKIKMDIEQETIVAGESASISVASASIIAKVSRDRIMDIYHRQYPQYNFCENRGYATADHRKAILEFGCCKIHRRSFRPVREAEEGLPLFPEMTGGYSEK